MKKFFKTMLTSAALLFATASIMSALQITNRTIFPIDVCLQHPNHVLEHPDFQGDIMQIRVMLQPNQAMAIPAETITPEHQELYPNIQFHPQGLKRSVAINLLQLDRNGNFEIHIYHNDARHAGAVRNLYYDGWTARLEQLP